MSLSSAKRTVVELLRSAIPDLQVVYLFGSHARNRTHPESDIDFAVLTPRPLAAESRWNLQEDLAAEIHSDVDLVDLRRASTVMQMQIVSSGTVVFESDPGIRHLFEMHTLSAYALLNEERAGILEKVQRRARVYGR